MVPHPLSPYDIIFLAAYAIPALVACFGTVIEAALGRGRVSTLLDGRTRLTLSMFFQRSLLPFLNLFVALSYAYRYSPWTPRKERF